MFGLLATVQASILGALILGPMGVEIDGPWWTLLLVAVLDALSGVALGLAAASMPRRTR